jgi:hypothetical protein
MVLCATLRRGAPIIPYSVELRVKLAFLLHDFRWLRRNWTSGGYPSSSSRSISSVSHCSSAAANAVCAVSSACVVALNRAGSRA